MDESKVIALENPGEQESDALTDVLREGARKMLAQAIEAEVEGFLAAHGDARDASWGWPSVGEWRYSVRVARVPS